MKPALPFIFMGTVLAGCAARSLPATFPSGSAASLATREAPKPRVLTTLRSDPPLPGEPASDWAGLEDPKDSQAEAEVNAEDAGAAPVTRKASSKTPQQGHQHHGH